MKRIPILGLVIIFSFAFGKARGAFFRENGYDSLLPQQEYKNRNGALVLNLADAETDYRKSRNNRKALLRLLGIARLRKTSRDSRIDSRLYADMAGISARLKMYPLAMKCYYKVAAGKRDNPALTGYADSIMYSGLIQTDSIDKSPYAADIPAKSEPVNSEDIVRSFEDGKTAVSYAILMQVKQPTPGRRKAFRGINNVGHMFITLIKYNADNSFACRSFGFYPHKSSILSATPLHPKAIAVLKDDIQHDWDEAIGKFISYKKFQKIMETLTRCRQRSYNLNKNNCTDFGLSMADIVGINILDTRGSWPLGKGNNPANAGQSLLEKKFRNTDPDYPETLFVSNSLTETDP